MKRAIIWVCAFIIGLSCGCAATRDKIDDITSRHDAALVSAKSRIRSADEKLATISNPPAAVTGARGDLKGATSDIGTAQAEVEKLKALAVKQSDKLEDLNDDWVGPRGKRVLLGIGVTLALVGLAIVLLKFGGLGGALASIPILGVVIAKIGGIGKPKAS